MAKEVDKNSLGELNVAITASGVETFNAQMDAAQAKTEAAASGMNASLGGLAKSIKGAISGFLSFLSIGTRIVGVVGLIGSAVAAVVSLVWDGGKAAQAAAEAAEANKRAWDSARESLASYANSLQRAADNNEEAAKRGDLQLRIGQAMRAAEAEKDADKRRAMMVEIQRLEENGERAIARMRQNRSDEAARKFTEDERKRIAALNDVTLSAIADTMDAEERIRLEAAAKVYKAQLAYIAAASDEERNAAIRTITAVSAARSKALEEERKRRIDEERKYQQELIDMQVSAERARANVIRESLDQQRAALESMLGSFAGSMDDMVRILTQIKNSMGNG